MEVKVNVAFAELTEYLKVIGNFTPGSDGKTYGPPESCYEGYPDELEIERVEVKGIDITSLLSEEQMDEIETKAIEQLYEEARS